MMRKVNKVLEKYLGDGPSYRGDIKMAAARIKHLLSAVDLDAEVLPENNLDMFSRLIISLKGEELSLAEWEILKEITEEKK